MKIEFTFSNGTSTLVLTPDSEREKTQIRLFREGSVLKLGGSPGAQPEALVLSTEIDPKS
jgi:hypothetical protein